MSTHAGAEAVSLHTATTKQLEAQVKTCQLCRLAKTRTNAVPGDGDHRAEVMFIGEGPGYHEDKQGRPFVGPAGQFLNELLGLAGFSRESVFITNVVKCRPPNNRDPQPDEIGACAPYLERQIALINPKVIVTLGRYSMSHFFPGERISQIHGTARVVDGRMCVAMYHPAAGLHQASLADVIRADFRKLPIFIQQSRRMHAPQGADEERLEEAEAVRDEVIHDPGTTQVLEQHAVVSTLHTQVAPPANADETDLFAEPEQASTVSPASIAPAPVGGADDKVGTERQETLPPAGAAQPAGRKPAKSGKAGQKADGEGYEQLSFFS